MVCYGLKTLDKLDIIEEKEKSKAFAILQNLTSSLALSPPQNLGNPIISYILEDYLFALLLTTLNILDI